MKPLTYLALGDSYTIGEGVPLHDSFPYQLVQLLRQTNLQVSAPEIVAKTGWTTGELHTHLANYQLANHYDLCSLLIGVNNQYRKQDLTSYRTDFADLLRLCIAKTKEAVNLCVISIPDWGATPFAEGQDKKLISDEINQFNEVNKSLTLEQGIHYIDIAVESREVGGSPEMLATDGLHPSSVTYKRWSVRLFDYFKKHIR